MGLLDDEAVEVGQGMQASDFRKYTGELDRK